MMICMVKYINPSPTPPHTQTVASAADRFKAVIMLLFIHFWLPLSGGVVSFFGVVFHYLHLAVEKKNWLLQCLRFGQ